MSGSFLSVNRGLFSPSANVGLTAHRKTGPPGFTASIFINLHQAGSIAPPSNLFYVFISLIHGPLFINSLFLRNFALPNNVPFCPNVICGDIVIIRKVLNNGNIGSSVIPVPRQLTIGRGRRKELSFILSTVKNR